MEIVLMSKSTNTLKQSIISTLSRSILKGQDMRRKRYVPEIEFTPEVVTRMAQGLIGVMTHSQDNAVINEAYRLYVEVMKKEKSDETV